MKNETGYRGQFEILSKREDVFLRNYKNRELLKGHKNISKLRSDIRKKSEAINKKSVKRLLSQLFLLMNESPKYMKLVEAVADFFVDNQSYFPMFEEFFDDKRVKRNKKIKKIISEGKVVDIPDTKGIDKERIDKDLEFLKSERIFDSRLRGLIGDIVFSKGTTGFRKYSMYEAHFIKKLISRGILERSGKAYRFTRYGWSLALIYLGKNPRRDDKHG